MSTDYELLLYLIRRIGIVRSSSPDTSGRTDPEQSGLNPINNHHKLRKKAHNPAYN